MPRMLWYPLLPPGWRSDAEFPVDNASLDKEALLRAVTIETDDDLNAHFISANHIGIAPPDQCAPINEPDEGLGALSRLPLELIWRILQQLDLESLDNMRRVNRRARLIVLAAPDLRRVTRFAGQTIVALVSTDLASHFTVADVAKALQTDKCLRCRRFAPLVFLPTLSRACTSCTYRPVVRDGDLIHTWNISAELAETLKTQIDPHTSRPYRIMTSLAGSYGPSSTSKGEDTSGAGQTCRGGPLLATRFPPEGNQLSVASYMFSSTTMPYVEDIHAPAPRVFRGLKCRGCDEMSRSVPSEERHVRGQMAMLRRYRYRRDEYLAAHFRICKRAQQLWLDQQLAGA
ncbi:hypothetical protein QBC34DRAFT_413379 [Podospora aff. communis PSN243]|uniref:F-box domain-containing protein n=1 Tax=Podospora aff. communis PSN243 TaxID=3040156 RepID=A0AAV9GAB8_9PEZI|nr:hypothetical protein QBC34DRAFT_413379 [Podospora aff. communis PSN243]